MSKFKYLFLLIFTIILFSCESSESGTEEKKVEEIKTDSGISNADIIRNPASANEPEDTVNVAKIQFVVTDYDFGEVESGEVVEQVFEFKNTGKVPLMITHARSTCGCTVPKWPKDPIPPGEGGAISVRFDTKNRKNKQVKPVYITANTYPAQTSIYLKGFVKEKK